MKNIKAYQRDRLILEFGILIAPYADLAQGTAIPEINEYRKAVAKVQGGIDKWLIGVKEFTTFAQDISFQREYQSLRFVFANLNSALPHLIDNNVSMPLDEIHSKFKTILNDTVDGFYKNLDNIPIEWEPEIFEANTPFTAYLRIREVLAVINKRFDYFDRYLKEDFFPLFLKSINKDVSVRLVTTLGNDQYGVKAISSISKLAFQEFTDYQLIEVDYTILHDRFLRVDEQIFNLGPGTDRAGIALTNFGLTDSTPKVHQEFDDIILQGRKVH